MEFIDLGAQQRRIRASLDARIKTVLDRGIYIMGPEVAELEAQLCAFTGARACVACSSGTDALLMPLMAWGVGAGDAVFVPAFTFFATSEMPALLGATPVFVDVDERTFTMRPDHLERAVRAVRERDPSIYPLPRPCLEGRLAPKALVAVDLFGQAADAAGLLRVARANGMHALEDAAQSFGAAQLGRKTCALGYDAAAVSFFPAKPLGCYGDGGAVFTDDEALAALLRSIRTHGKGADKYDNVRLGINGRLDTLQAAVLLAKMEIFADELARRARVAAWYGAAFAACPEVTAPAIASGNESVFAQYAILVPDGRREGVIAHLAARNIPTAVYYPKPQHALGAFAALGYAPGDFPAALRLSRDILALPFHPYMERDEVEAIAEAVIAAL